MAQGGTAGGAGGAGGVSLAVTRLKVIDPHIVQMMRDVMEATETAPRLQLGNRAGAGGGGGGATTNVVQKGALKQGFTFDREKIEELVGAGFSAYEGDIRQQQIDATKQNLSQYKDEFATHYAKEAKAQQEKLARGELPKTYEAALDRESDRLTRLMVAQGHNPAESGFGADTVVRGLMDLESKFIAEERAYWRAIGEGATGMNKYIQELESRQAREPDVGLAGMGELATKAAGTLADLI